MHWWILAMVVACVGEGQSDTGTDTDSDTDADGDSDPNASCPVPRTLPVGDLAGCTGLWTSDPTSWVETYDGSGNLVDILHDRGYQGLLHITMTYDSSNRLSEIRTDFGNDGTDESATTYTGGADGFRSEEVTSGLGASRTTWENGPCGPIRTVFDFGDDGIVDLVTNTTYTPTTVTVSADMDVDGNIDSISVTDHDPVLGRPVHVEIESNADINGPETVQDFTYDADGRYVVITHEFYGSLTSTSYSYDADGRTIERRIVGDGLNSVESAV